MLGEEFCHSAWPARSDRPRTYPPRTLAFPCQQAMSLEELAARGSVLYAQRLGGVSLGADKTWIESIDIDADAQTEATDETEFYSESIAASVGSHLTVLAVLLPPRTENAQATYADHGKSRDLVADPCKSRLYKCL